MCTLSFAVPKRGSSLLKLPPAPPFQHPANMSDSVAEIAGNAIAVALKERAHLLAQIDAGSRKVCVRCKPEKVCIQDFRLNEAGLKTHLLYGKR